MSEGIKVVLFDLGNVLIDFDHTIAAKRISQFCDLNPKEIFNLFFDSNITALFEEGKITPADFYLKVKEMLGLRLSYEKFVPIWNDIFFLSAKNRAVYSLINNLRQHYKTALISNINTLHYEYLKGRFPVFNIFDKIFVSCEVGVIKPNSLIYQKALEDLKTEAQDAFYTDDRPELVEGARILGINSFVFSGIRQLRVDLKNCGINVN